MNPILRSVPVIAVMSLVLGVSRAAPTSPSQDPADAHLAVIKQYCVGCHSDIAKIGGISFQGITADSIAKNPELFEKAVRKLRGRVMPPPGARQPDAKAVDGLVAYLEDSLDKLPAPQHITDGQLLHRLNRKEYENAVHDLLLVDVNGADLLPPDDTAQGFDNIASALQVSPSFIEQYVLAAHNVASAGARQEGQSSAGLDVPRCFRQPAHTRSRITSGDARRHSCERGSARRRPIQNQHCRHGQPYLGQRHGI